MKRSQPVFIGLVVFAARHVFERRGNVDPVKISIVLVGVLFVPNGCIAWGIDYGEHYTTAVGSLSVDNSIAGIVGISYIGSYIEPRANLILDIGAEIIAFVKCGFNNATLVGITA